jgi:transcriptional regulator with XRE-family HTH domain
MEVLPEAGRLLEAARVKAGLSKREAARRAGISEGRWRQVVTGLQKQAGVRIPVNPRPATLSAMARAVGADVARVLEAGGFSQEAAESSGLSWKELIGWSGYVAASADDAGESSEVGGLSDDEIARRILEATTYAAKLAEEQRKRMGRPS